MNIIDTLRVLRNEFGDKLTVTSDATDKDLENVFDYAEYKEFKKRVSPADYIRTYRENAGLTQTELAEKFNVTRAYICDIGQRDGVKQYTIPNRSTNDQR